MDAGQPPPSAEGAACGGPGWVKDVEQGGNISLDCFGGISFESQWRMAGRGGSWGRGQESRR